MASRCRLVALALTAAIAAEAAVLAAEVPNSDKTAPAGAPVSGKPSAARISEDLRTQLAASKYVYISSQRKDGSWSKPAEIWFMYHDGAVWVGTLPTSWRAKRIKAGRPAAKISVGKLDGPSFEATGEIVQSPAESAVLLETYAKKYPDGWSQYETRFRQGFQDGSRVLIKYTPK